MLGRPTLFRQTLLGLIGALFFVHLVVFLAVVRLPQNNAGMLSIGDVTRQLARPGCPTDTLAPERLAGLETKRQPLAPEPSVRSMMDVGLNVQLADALGVPTDDVRIFWPRGTEVRLSRPTEVPVAGKMHRLGQTIFFGGAVFGRKTDGGWCVHSIAQSSIVEGLKWRSAYMILVSLLAMLPLAWLFARKLSRPIRDFAEAADRIGRDSGAPLLEESGPAELRVASRALNEMQRGIQQQFRNREAMIAAIAHDLRTPLSRIAFRVANLPTAVRDPVQRDVEQMKAMIAATLEYSRGVHGSGVKEATDLAELLAGLVEEEQALGSDIAFTRGTPSGIVHGDAIEFARLFQNLIDNARAFGGAMEIDIAADQDMVRVTVADRGPGIAPDKLPAMFTPFVRSDPSRNRERGGVGLGLPIARTIARRYGGDLVLANRPGGGLIAVVTVPRSVSQG
jgi:signal transduction histidine kinase